MEDEIKEELEKRYKNLEIEVDFIEFRKYSITIRLNESTLTLEYIWDNNFTNETNIRWIGKDIENFILDYYILYRRD